MVHAVVYAYLFVIIFIYWSKSAEQVSVTQTSLSINFASYLTKLYYCLSLWRPAHDNGNNFKTNDGKTNALLMCVTWRRTNGLLMFCHYFIKKHLTTTAFVSNNVVAKFRFLNLILLCDSFIEVARDLHKMKFALF